MEAIPLPRSSTERPVDTPILLSDLSLLVLGAAVAFALPWIHPLIQTVTWQGTKSIPLRYSLSCFAKEGIRKAALALLPVLIARRARKAQGLRIAEFLLVICAVPLLPQLMDHAGIFHYEQRSIVAPASKVVSTLVLDRPSWSILMRIWGIGIAFFVLFLVGRRRWPAWVVSTCMVACLLFSYEWAFYPLASAVHRLSLVVWGDDLSLGTGLALELALILASGLVPGIVTAAALRDGFGRRRDLDGAERIAILLALVIFMLDQATGLCESCSGRMPAPADLPILALQLSLPWLSLVVGYGIIRAWSRTGGRDFGSIDEIPNP